MAVASQACQLAWSGLQRAEARQGLACRVVQVKLALRANRQHQPRHGFTWQFDPMHQAPGHDLRLTRKRRLLLAQGLELRPGEEFIDQGQGQQGQEQECLANGAAGGAAVPRVAGVGHCLDQAVGSPGAEDGPCQERQRQQEHGQAGLAIHASKAGIVGAQGPRDLTTA